MLRNTACISRKTVYQNMFDFQDMSKAICHSIWWLTTITVIHFIEGHQLIIISIIRDSPCSTYISFILYWIIFHLISIINVPDFILTCTWNILSFIFSLAIILPHIHRCWKKRWLFFTCNMLLFLLGCFICKSCFGSQCPKLKRLFHFLCTQMTWYMGSLQIRWCRRVCYEGSSDLKLVWQWSEGLKIWSWCFSAAPPIPHRNMIHAKPRNIGLHMQVQTLCKTDKNSSTFDFGNKTSNCCLVQYIQPLPVNAHITSIAQEDFCPRESFECRFISELESMSFSSSN